MSFNVCLASPITAYIVKFIARMLLRANKELDLSSKGQHSAHNEYKDSSNE
jgi:hypothetical protein